MSPTMSLAVILALTVACSSGRPQVAPQVDASAPPRAPAIPDSRIGLAPGTAFEQPPQEPVAFNDADPGESVRRTRPNSDFPPVIPHSVADLLPITAEENLCLDCHGIANAADIGAPAAPGSHHVDLRNAPETTAGALAGARYNCVACHVAQTATAPLVAIAPPHSISR